MNGFSARLTSYDFAHLHDLLCENLVKLEEMLALLLLGADLTRRMCSVL
jgi:hypothetical protein